MPCNWGCDSVTHSVTLIVWSDSALTPKCVGNLESMVVTVLGYGLVGGWDVFLTVCLRGYVLSVWVSMTDHMQKSLSPKNLSGLLYIGKFRRNVFLKLQFLRQY